MLRLVVAASLLVVVAGCSDPEPKEPKPTPSATPTVTAPTMPAQAKENTPEGASAFVAHYIKVSNYAASTGDVEELSRLSDPKCTGCQEYIKLYRDTYKAGGYFKGGDWRIGSLSLNFDPAETQVETHMSAPPSKYRTSSSSPEKDASADESQLSFTVKKIDQGWIVTRFGLADAR